MEHEVLVSTWNDDPTMRVLLYCFKPPSPRAAAAPPPRQAVGPVDPAGADDATGTADRSSAFMTGFHPDRSGVLQMRGPESVLRAPEGIQAGRGRPATTIMGSCRLLPGAAVKGPLRRPPAALDCRLLPAHESAAVHTSKHKRGTPTVRVTGHSRLPSAPSITFDLIGASLRCEPCLLDEPDTYDEVTNVRGFDGDAAPGRYRAALEYLIVVRGATQANRGCNRAAFCLGRTEQLRGEQYW